MYSTSIAALYFVSILGFDALLYCICAFECDVYVGVFKWVGKFSDLWTVLCECCPFFVVC